MTKDWFVRRALSLSVLCALATVAGCASSGGPSTSGAEPVGMLNFALTLPSGQDLNAIDWVITGPNGSATVVRSGTVNLASSSKVAFDVANLPVSNNYAITLTGQSTDGVVTCVGSASFNVHPRTVTNVTDLLRCTVAASDAGTARINGTLYNCATYGAVGASPSEVVVGGTVTLSATATAPNASAITYNWSAPSGTLSSPTSATTNFTCTAPGSVTVTLTVGDGSTPDGGTCDPAQSTTTLQVMCDTPANSGPQDSGTVGSLSSAWSAFLPLVSGSTINVSAGTTADVSGHGYSATYAHGVTFSTAGLAQSGSGEVAIPPEYSIPAVDLTGSYSISVWVTMTDTSGWRTFVAADGTQVSEFYLQKRSDTNAFGFALSTADANGGVSAPCIASASFAPIAHTLYHLVATRDSATGLDTLYVNGAVAGTASCPVSMGVGWPAATFGIGHGMYNGSNTDYAAGTISGVGLINRVVTASEVTALYALGPGSNGNFGLGSIAPSNGGADAGTSGGSESANGTGPCDIYATGGTPCAAAHSTVRALYGNFNGSLYQVRRSSDNATLDIGVLTDGGFANAAAQDTFCSGTTCTISIIYDQSPNHNDLRAAPSGGAVNSPDSEAIATSLRVTVGGHWVYGVYVAPGVGYRNDRTSGIATGDEPEGEYMVTSGKNTNGGCCFDYGNAETSGSDTGNGHMEAIYVGVSKSWGSGSGNGPWVMADLENGLFSGGTVGYNAADTSVSFDYVTALVKGKLGTVAIRAGNAQSGPLTTMWAGTRPSGYATMYKEGAIILGIGGDNSNAAGGSFFEGVMTAGYPADASEDAVQANIVAAGYGAHCSGPAIFDAR